MSVFVILEQGYYSPNNLKSYLGRELLNLPCVVSWDLN